MRIYYTYKQVYVNIEIRTIKIKRYRKIEQFSTLNKKIDHCMSIIVNHCMSSIDRNVVKNSNLIVNMARNKVTCVEVSFLFAIGDEFE